MDSVWALAKKNRYQVYDIDKSGISALIKITSSCRSRCRYCLSWQTAQKILSINEIDHIINDIQKFKGHRIILSGGEPTTHPEFALIVKKFNEIDTHLNIITDGQYSCGSSWVSMVNEITFSVDTYSSDIYRYIRGIDGLQNALENISWAVKKGINVSVNIVLTHQSLESLEKTVDILVNKGVSRIYFLELETHLIVGNSLLPTNDDMSELLQKTLPSLRRKHPGIIPENTLFFSNKNRDNSRINSCIIPWMHMTIRPNGNVYPCCRIGDDTPKGNDISFCLGNVKETSLRVMWRSLRRKQIQATIANTPPLPCLKCTIGKLFQNEEKVWSQIESIRM